MNLSPFACFLIFFCPSTVFDGKSSKKTLTRVSIFVANHFKFLLLNSDGNYALAKYSSATSSDAMEWQQTMIDAVHWPSWMLFSVTASRSQPIWLVLSATCCSCLMLASLLIFIDCWSLSLFRANRPTVYCFLFWKHCSVWNTQSEFSRFIASKFTLHEK